MLTNVWFELKHKNGNYLTVVDSTVFFKHVVK